MHCSHCCQMLSKVKVLFLNCFSYIFHSHFQQCYFSAFFVTMLCAQSRQVIINVDPYFSFLSNDYNLHFVLYIIYVPSIHPSIHGCIHTYIHTKCVFIIGNESKSTLGYKKNKICLSAVT